MEIVTNSDEGHYKTALAFSLAQFFSYIFCIPKYIFISLLNDSETTHFQFQEVNI